MVYPEKPLDTGTTQLMVHSDLFTADEIINGHTTIPCAHVDAQVLLHGAGASKDRQYRAGYYSSSIWDCTQAALIGWDVLNTQQTC